MGIQNLLFKEGMRLEYFEEIVTVKAVSPTFIVIEDNFKKPIMLPPSDLIKAYRNQYVKICTPAKSIVYQPLTNEEDKYEAEKLERLLLALDSEPNPRSHNTMRKIIQRIQKKFGYSDDEMMSTSTLLRKYDKWIENHLDVACLIKKPKKKRAPRVDECALKLFDDILYEMFLTPNGPNAHQCWKVYDEQRKTFGSEVKAIKRSRFYEMINELNPLDVIRAREGNDAARRFAQTSNGKYQLDFPLQRVEIDAVHLNVGLIDDETSQYIGVPILYLAIDVKTRCIVGYSISYGTSVAETSDAVIELLTHCVTPKKKARHAINDFPLTGRIHTVVGDAGKAFKNKRVTSFLAQIKCTHITTETASPWRKGVIEAYNRTLRSHFGDYLPGYVRHNGTNTYTQSVEAMATLSLDDFINATEMFILDVYHENSHAGLYGHTPLSICEKALEDYCPRPIEDLSLLESYRGEEMTGRIQPSVGIQLNHAFYQSEQLAELRMLLKPAKKGASPEVSFNYDKSDISQISVLNELTGEMFIVSTTNPMITPGMSLYEFRALRQGKTAKEIQHRTFKGNHVVTEAIKAKAALAHEAKLAKKAAEKAKKAEEVAKAKSAQERQQSITNSNTCNDDAQGIGESALAAHIEQNQKRMARNHGNRKNATYKQPSNTEIFTKPETE